MFKKIENDATIKKVVQDLFEINLDIYGGWGYNEQDCTVIESLNGSVKQLEDMLIKVRSYVEMNISQPKEDRYVGINIKELKRENIKNIDKVLYEVSGMLESDYTKFISEYKNKHDSQSFDMTEHFNRRKHKTLIREEYYYFDISRISHV